MGARNDELLERYQRSVMGVFGLPPLVLDHGSGCHVWDVDGNRYLDLVGGIAVNALGHGHPALVTAVSKQASEGIHISNLFTSEVQIALAERLLDIAGAPEGSAVFLCNSGAEAIEAAIKLSRRTGRTGLVAAEGAFHGRTTGALALTHKVAYRQPFEPLIPGVTHVPYGDEAALRAAVTEETAAVVLEPIQGEAGVLSPGTAYLRTAREVTREHGALLILDEIQTGIGRTGTWFAFQQAGIVPDAITVAKGLGGGVPVGGLIAFGEHNAHLLTAGQHGTTFGGNPLAAAASLAVLDTIESEGLLEHARVAGDHLVEAVTALQHPLVTGVRGAGLLRAITLAHDVAPQLAAAAREAGFIVNPVAPAAIRLAPPLVVTLEQLDSFVEALPALLDTIESERLLEHARVAGDHLVEAVTALQHPLVTGVRGAGLLRAITLAHDVAPQLAAAARDAGFIVNPVAPAAIRLAPPLVVTLEQLDSFVEALPALLDACTPGAGDTPETSATPATPDTPEDHR